MQLEADAVRGTGDPGAEEFATRAILSPPTAAEMVRVFEPGGPKGG